MPNDADGKRTSISFYFSVCFEFERGCENLRSEAPPIGQSNIQFITMELQKTPKLALSRLKVARVFFSTFKLRSVLKKNLVCENMVKQKITIQLSK